MAQKPIAMEYLKQILQLQKDGVPIREMARRTGISRNSVRKYLSLIGTAEDQPEVTDHKTLAEKAYGSDTVVHDANRFQELIEHFGYAQGELSKNGITRQLFWKEYIQQHPDGYVYSHYCYHLSVYLKNRDISMHLEYQPADMIMIDFAGKKQYYINISTGEQIPCEVFVAILPFNGLIFCYAVHSQQTADFIQCINAMLKFYGSVPSTILCDNLKTAVTRPNRYEWRCGGILCSSSTQPKMHKCTIVNCILYLNRFINQILNAMLSSVYSFSLHAITNNSPNSVNT